MSILTKNISKIYGTQKVLNNVNIELKKGEIVGLLGPNGAGKSTLMKIITCFIPPTSGEAFVDGYNIFEQQEKIKSIIGYLPEHNPLYSEMYIREYLEFMARLHKLGKDKKKSIENIIEQTGLGPEIKKKIGMLSKGYRQRVGLAQALLHNPQVLILDEPTSGLDPNQLVEIRNLISDIGKEKTVLLSTHIMQEIEAMCNRVIIIHKGNIVADKKTDEISTLLKNKVLKVEFSEAVDHKKLKDIPFIEEIKQINPTTWQIISKEDKDIRKYINKFAVDNNVSINSLSSESHQLENIFHQLTK